jgi:polyhydroxybutyrate depolymerase
LIDAERLAIPMPDGPRECSRWPAGPDSSILLFLHGTGGTAEWAADEARLPEYCAENNITLLAPEACRHDPHSPPKFLTNPQRWNDGSEPDNSLFAHRADDVGFLAQLLDDEFARHGHRPAVVTGFSNGAAMAFRFATERRDRIAGVAPVAGYCWAAPPIRPPVPTLFAIGELDPLVPPRGGTVTIPWGNRLAQRIPIAIFLERWAAANGCNTDAEIIFEDWTHTRTQYRGPVPFEVLSVPGLGHHWPGGKGQLNPRIGGPPGGALDFNAALGEFIRRVAGMPACVL